MIEQNFSSPDNILKEATKLVLAIDKVAKEIDVPELKKATDGITIQKQKILQRHFNNSEKN